MKKLLILAIALRLLVSAFYFHPDIKTYYFQSSFLKKGVFNIYTYLQENKKDLPLKEEFVYFPLTYLGLGTYSAVISPILGQGFDDWLADAGSSSVKNPYVFTYLTFMKLPYLALDILIAMILMKFFKDQKNKERVWTIWLFNPFTIILIYVFSNVDIIPAAITLLAFLMIKKGKFKNASVLLGIASGFKLYPLLFLPFLLLKGKNFRERVVLALLPLSILFITVLPFSSKEFIDSALVSGLTTRIFNPGVNIGFNETIIMGLAGISALFFYAYLFDQKVDLFKYWIVIFLLVFSFSHFHIQWLMWIAPFIAILVVKKPKIRFTVFFISILAFIIPFLYADRSMSISLFRVYSTNFDILPTPFSIIEQTFDPYSLQSILHSVLAGASILVIFKLFRKGEEV